MAYVNIPNSVFGAGKAARALDMRNLRDNLPAMAAGDAGAPKIQGKALDIGIGNLSGNTAIVGLDDVASLLLVASVRETGDIFHYAVYQLTSDSGSSWGSQVNLSSFATIVAMVGYNGIRLYNAIANSTASGCAIWVKGE